LELEDKKEAERVLTHLFSGATLTYVGDDLTSEYMRLQFKGQQGLNLYITIDNEWLLTQNRSLFSLVASKVKVKNIYLAEMEPSLTICFTDGTNLVAEGYHDHYESWQAGTVGDEWLIVACPGRDVAVWAPEEGLWETNKQVKERRMDIYDFLDMLQEQLQTLSLTEIEKYYDALCRILAEEALADSIKQLSLDAYQEQLTQGLEKSVEQVVAGVGSAIYFEYDMDDNWQGSFYLCTEYVPGEDDWACEWEEVVEGSSLKEFGALIMQHGFDKNDTSIGVTMYLVARTVCTFVKAVDSVKEAKSIPLAIAFHDQDSIYHLHR